MVKVVTQVYRLPSRQTTNSQREYLDEWGALATPFNKFLKPLGYRVAGYDPGFLCTSNGGAQSLSLPVNVVEAILRRVM